MGHDATRGLASNFEGDTSGLLIEMGYLGTSTALVLASETLIMARVSDSPALLALFVGAQVALCFCLWVATRRFNLLEHISPTPVCILFLLGVVWVFGVGELGVPKASSTQGAAGLGAGVALSTLPAAILLGLGNSINGCLLIDYCRRSAPSDFSRVAVGGAAVGALLNYLVSYIMPSMASALCGVLAVGWYLFSRAISRFLSKREINDADWLHKRGDAPSFYLVVISLCVSCGILPCTLFSPGATLPGQNMGPWLVASLSALALAMTAVGLHAPRISLTTLVFVSTLAIATGYLLLPLHVTVSNVAAIALVCTFELCVACTVVYVYAQFAGDIARRPGRFWGTQALVLAVTSLCTALGSFASHAREAASLMPMCLVALWCLLLFVILFARTWVATLPVANTSSKGEPSEPQTHCPPSRQPTDETIEQAKRLRARCNELARQTHLTGRESQVLPLIISGWTVDMIAKQLVVSPDTVRTHTKHLYAKLDVHSRGELLARVGVGSEEERP
ncbi:MAG: helix-turn-helix transcriptional regulator [Coriobacteriales bacterium]|jgi:DNA-binding CsgD family transcriptional regulator